MIRNTFCPLFLLEAGLVLQVRPNPCLLIPDKKHIHLQDKLMSCVAQSQTKTQDVPVSKYQQRILSVFLSKTELINQYREFLERKIALKCQRA